MLFLWTTTKYGKIWLDGESFKQIVTKRLPKDYFCKDVSFVGEKNLLNIYLAVPENTPVTGKYELDEKFRELFAKSGISVNIDWIEVALQDSPKATPIWTMPLFWAGAAAAFTALFHLGIKGILYSLFAAVIGYGVSWVLLTEDGQKQVKSLIKQFRG